MLDHNIKYIMALIDGDNSLITCFYKALEN